MKVDLGIWTYNSEKTLEPCLKSIDKTISPRKINQKIMVDGKSKDKTKKIGEKFGWHIVEAKKVGIPFQANQFLNMVETEFYASFEHDIILAPNWLERMFRHMKSEKVAVVQGVRQAIDPIMRSIEEHRIKRIDMRYGSIDNTLYRSSVIREIGGYNPECLVTTDRDLQDRVWEKGYEWITDRNVVSGHMRGNFKEYARHYYNLQKKRTYKERKSILNVTRIFFTSPLRALDIISRTRCPFVMVAYPYLCFMSLKGCLENVSKH